jgi:hypothetical protein
MTVYHYYYYYCYCQNFFPFFFAVLEMLDKCSTTEPWARILKTISVIVFAAQEPKEK